MMATPLEAPEVRDSAAASLNAVWVACVVEMLVAAGVRHAVLCPGGRASAMCLALDAHPGISVEMVSTDERSGAFVALGLAKAGGTPAAVVTTSGSAIANVLPALTEADASDIPLVAISCDRPRVLRGASFGQMADHLGATRAFVRAQADLDDPCDSAGAVLAMRAQVTQALAAMLGRVPGDALPLPRIDALPSPRRATRGPVHVNVPLTGVYDAVETHAVSADTVRAARTCAALPAAQGASYSSCSSSDTSRCDAGSDPVPGIVARVMARVKAARAEQSPRAGIDGVIVVGPEPAVPLRAICALARRTGFPVLADVASGLRAGHDALSPDAALRGEAGALIVSAFDVLGAGRLARAHPELVIRFGLAPVLPTLHTWFETHGDAPTIRISPQRIAYDYLHRGLDPRDVLVAPAADALGVLADGLCRAAAVDADADADADVAAHLRAAVRTAWRERWANVAAQAARERRACVAALGWGEVVAVHRVLAARGFAFVHIGNSMPMRHADIGYDLRAGPQDVYASRGVSGIDGTLSTFVGEALARREPGLLVLGDQAFVHDLSALAAAQRVTTPACVCVIDNGGGAIFDFLPVAREAGFRRAIRNPYAMHLAALAQGFGLAHRRADSRATLDAALDDARRHAGVTIVEIVVDAHSGIAQIAQLARAVGAA
ncbi:thiamine pyrophosphate-binding protein [Paraburkholderia sp. B3]|uniref:thiamine pyrophosphate-binding protein n=1 Tax=Paraburkholderia sp. B3 TaxID=3134791 RepID=UPI00398198EE